MRPLYHVGLWCSFAGYANEVGEAFRAQVHVRLVHASYLVASGYVVADALHKGQQALEVRPFLSLRSNYTVISKWKSCFVSSSQALSIDTRFSYTHPPFVVT